MSKRPLEQAQDNGASSAKRAAVAHPLAAASTAPLKIYVAMHVQSKDSEVDENETILGVCRSIVGANEEVMAAFIDNCYGRDEWLDGPDRKYEGDGRLSVSFVKEPEQGDWGWAGEAQVEHTFCVKVHQVDDDPYATADKRAVKRFERIFNGGEVDDDDDDDDDSEEEQDDD